MGTSISSGILGIQSTRSAMGTILSSPSVATAMMEAPRALHSWMLETVLSCTLSAGTTTTTGKPFSSSAMGPCFISPAGYASACRYEISLILRAPS